MSDESNDRIRHVDENLEKIKNIEEFFYINFHLKIVSEWNVQLTKAK